MKKIHYINVGMPKSGTTALFMNLLDHPDIDYQGIKENSMFITDKKTIAEYIEYYENYDVSMNFNPAIWAIEKYKIEELLSVTSHISIIFRNPFEYIRSLYYFIPSSSNSEDFFEMLFEQKDINYSAILSRWIKLVKNKPFKVLFHHDLSSRDNSLHEITKFLGLKDCNLLNNQYNVSMQKNKEFLFTNSQILILNKMIDRFEKMINRSLGWKKDNSNSTCL